MGKEEKDTPSSHLRNRDMRRRTNERSRGVETELVPSGSRFLLLLELGVERENFLVLDGVDAEGAVVLREEAVSGGGGNERGRERTILRARTASFILQSRLVIGVSSKRALRFSIPAIAVASSMISSTGEEHQQGGKGEGGMSTYDRGSREAALCRHR